MMCSFPLDSLLYFSLPCMPVTSTRLSSTMPTFEWQVFQAVSPYRLSSLSSSLSSLPFSFLLFHIRRLPLVRSPPPPFLLSCFHAHLHLFGLIFGQKLDFDKPNSEAQPRSSKAPLGQPTSLLRLPSPNVPLLPSPNLAPNPAIRSSSASSSSSSLTRASSSWPP